MDQWNDIIQNTMNPNISKNYFSHDSYHSVDDPHGHLAATLNNTEILNDLNTSDIPKHKLTLKIGDICLLMRNIAPDEGLTRNTRLRVISLGLNTVRVRKVTNDKEYTIHKISFKHQLPFGRSFEMIRNQLPLSLAYAITINKSQGQEFQKVLLDLTTPCFSHGHLYVGLSRIRRPQDILVYTQDDLIDDDATSLKYTTNVVYKELLFDV